MHVKAAIREWSLASDIIVIFLLMRSPTLRRQQQAVKIEKES